MSRKSRLIPLEGFFLSDFAGVLWTFLFGFLLGFLLGFLAGFLEDFLIWFGIFEICIDSLCMEDRLSKTPLAYLGKAYTSCTPPLRGTRLLRKPGI